MKLPKLPLALGILLAALVQTGFLGTMITDRASLLRTGTEVALDTTMIDPRDLFRGHYVRLDLSISRIDRARVIQEDGLTNGDPVFVELVEGNDGYWQPRALWRDMPDAPKAPVIRGTYRSSWDDRIRISFPFDRYFAPKDRALELEGMRNEARLGIILALDGKGNGAVKGLMLDGQRIYDEPLY